MSRWFRWQWFAPRLALLIVALLGFEYALGLATRSAAVHYARVLFGPTADIQHARVSLIESRIALSGITLIDPNCKTGTCLKADCCEMQVEPEPMMQKRLVVERGRVTGLRFTSAQPSKSDDSSQKWKASCLATRMFGDNADEKAVGWFKTIDRTFTPEVVNDLESVRLATSLCDQWPNQSATLEARSQQLKERAVELQSEMSAADANPLRHDAVGSDIPARIASLRADFEALDADVKSLAQKLEDERRQIVAARRHDGQLLRDRLAVEPIDQEALTAYFLRSQFAPAIEQLAQWLRSTRILVDKPILTSQEGRGQNILFAGMQKSPGLIIRNLELCGTGNVLNQSINFRGHLTGISSRPSLHTEPVRLRLTSKGTAPFELRATFDRAQPVPHDELLVDWRNVQIPEHTLGRADELQLKLAPSVGSLSVSLRLDGDQINGDVQLVQQQVQMNAMVAGDLADVPLATPLQSTMGEVKSFAIHVSLRGTIDEPSCKLWSNLGPAVAESMQYALRRAADEHAETLLARSRQLVDEHLASLERHVAEHQASFANNAGNILGQLDSTARRQTRRERLTIEHVGRRLPQSSILR